MSLFTAIDFSFWETRSAALVLFELVLDTRREDLRMSPIVREMYPIELGLFQEGSY